MGDLWIQVLTRDARDLAMLNAQFRPKVLAEDVIGYEARIRAEPDSAALHDDAALLYLDLGRAADAVRHFEIAAGMKPDSAAAQFNLGTALVAAGRIDEAIARFRRALELRPDYGLAHNNLGGVLFKLGRLDEAERHLTDAVRFDANNAEARDNLGRLLAARGRTAQAIEQFKEAARLRPDWAAPHAEAAWLLAVAGDERVRNPVEAVTLATRAVELTERRDPVALDALAASHASAGDFVRAIATAEAALSLTSSVEAARPVRSALRCTGKVVRSGCRRPLPTLKRGLTRVSVGVTLLQIHFASRSYRR